MLLLRQLLLSNIECLDKHCRITMKFLQDQRFHSNDDDDDKKLTDDMIMPACALCVIGDGWGWNEVLDFDSEFRKSHQFHKSSPYWDQSHKGQRGARK